MNANSTQIEEFFDAAAQTGLVYRMNFAKSKLDDPDALLLEHDNLLLSLEQSIALELDLLPFEFADCLHEYMMHSGDWQRWSKTLSNLYDYATDVQAPDIIFAQLHLQVGAALHDRGEIEAAESQYRKALQLAEADLDRVTGQEREEVLHIWLACKERIANDLFTQARYEDLETLSQEARALLPADTLFRDALRIQMHLANAYSARGDYEKALTLHDANLSLLRELPDKQGEANTLYWMGMILMILGRCRQALEFHEDSLAIKRKLRDQRGILVSLRELAQTYECLGEYDLALQHSYQAHEIAVRIGYKRGIANTAQQLAFLEEEGGDLIKARKQYEQAIQTYEELGHQKAVVSAMLKIAELDVREKDYEHALVVTDQAMSLLEDMDEMHDRPFLLCVLGDVYTAQGDFARAQGHYLESLAIRKSSGMRAGQGLTLRKLGQWAIQKKDWQQAVIYLEEALLIFQDLQQEHRVQALLKDLDLIEAQQT